ncbi:MAG TPA: extracellular solute-binding protein [Anaerolineae bacterium]|nr:extracellular solute-binding protein [Anaerolineae bacterium]
MDGDKEMDPVYGDIDNLELEGTEVVFMHQHGSSRLTELMAIIEEFNSTNEYGITVSTLEEGGYGDIYDKMIAGLTTGDVPNLVVAYQNQAAAYMVADGLVSLDPYINSEKYGLTDEEMKDYFQGFVNGDRLPQFGGESFGFPPNRSMEVMYYNADWLAELNEAGAISFDGPPQTPEQFQEAACAAANNPFSKNPTPDMSVGYEIRTDASSVAALTLARESDVYDYDNNAFTYNNDATAAALFQMYELLEEGCASLIAERYAEQGDFANGVTLFTMGSSSGLPFYASDVADGAAGGFEWSVAPIPYTGADPVQNIYGASVSIPKTTPEEQLAAWIFVKFYTSPEIQARWARASNYFPVRASVAEGLDDYFEENPAYKAAFDLLPYAKAEPPVAGYDNVRDEANEAFNRVLAAEDANGDGEFTAEDVTIILEELDAKANELLEESAP